MAWVIIWENNMLTTGRRWMGHAALNLGSNWSNNILDHNSEYVSYVPGGAGLQDTKGALDRMESAKTAVGASDAKIDGKYGAVGNVKKGVMADGGSNNTFLEDLEFEGYLPDHIIRIDGLNYPNMRAKWAEINGKQNRHYKAVQKNCSTIVARILRAGGISASSWAKHSSVWTPIKIRKLAHSGGGTDTKWADFLANQLNPSGITWDMLTNDKGKLLGRTYSRSSIASSQADCRFP